VGKRYGPQTALEAISLTVREQEIVGIVGPNGAGKTTLFNIISGLVKPSHGRVLLFGRDVTGWPPQRLCRAGIARTFQIPKPFAEMTAVENVLTALWFGGGAPVAFRQGRDAAGELLELVGLEKKRSTRAGDLTPSEQRRLEVARALATDPRLLLLDEIAAGLSPQAVKQSTGLVERLRGRGLTLLIIDHFLNLTVKVSDRLFALDQGEMVAEGLPLDVMHHPDVVCAYLGERHRARQGEAES
jgi:branched-chain amino acid transport system ATP-binding protein